MIQNNDTLTSFINWMIPSFHHDICICQTFESWYTLSNAKISHCSYFTWTHHLRKSSEHLLQTPSMIHDDHLHSTFASQEPQSEARVDRLISSIRSAKELPGDGVEVEVWSGPIARVGTTNNQTHQTCRKVGHIFTKVTMVSHVFRTNRWLEIPMLSITVYTLVSLPW